MEKEEGKKKKGLFARLTKRLGKTKQGVFNRIKQTIRLRSRVDEELLEEIEELLVQADVSVETTQRIIDKVRNDPEARKLRDPEAIIEKFKQGLLEVLSPRERTLPHSAETKPLVILVAGVNGVGKTTTIGKMALRFQQEKKKVMLVAADTFRAAAIEQLGIWAERTKSDFIHQTMGADAAAVCFDAMQAARARGTDVVIIDTAGRLHTKVNLMEELKKIIRVVQKLQPEAPQETLLVLDATTGQNAVQQVKIFGEALSLTGLIMTKLDGTAKGGTLLTICEHFTLPVVMIGVGEQVEDLRDFDAREYTEALFAD